MSVEIREARENDIQGILEIVNYAITHTTAIYHYDLQTYEEQLTWFQDKKSKGFPIYIAEEEGKVLGFGGYGPFRFRKAYNKTIEHSIYIHHKARRKGIGRLLMNRLITQARKEGYHTMIAGVDMANSSSKLFHEQFGFIEIGTFKEIGYKFDKWLDVCFLQLMLDE